MLIQNYIESEKTETADREIETLSLKSVQQYSDTTKDTAGWREPAQAGQVRAPEPETGQPLLSRVLSTTIPVQAPRSTRYNE